MTTNREWLYSLDVADLADWFDSEHVDLEAENKRLEIKNLELGGRMGGYKGNCELLKKKVNELTVERDYWKELNEYHAFQYDQACDDIDKLTAEREFYREQLGRILDLVDEMRYIAASVHSRDEGLA